MEKKIIQLQGEELAALDRTVKALYDEDISWEFRAKLFKGLKEKYNGTCVMLSEGMLDFTDDFEFGDEAHHALMYIDISRTGYPFDGRDEYFEEYFDYDFWKQQGIL